MIVKKLWEWTCPWSALPELRFATNKQEKRKVDREENKNKQKNKQWRFLIKHIPANLSGIIEEYVRGHLDLGATSARYRFILKRTPPHTSQVCHFLFVLILSSLICFKSVSNRDTIMIFDLVFWGFSWPQVRKWQKRNDEKYHEQHCFTTFLIKKFVVTFSLWFLL